MLGKTINMWAMRLSVSTPYYMLEPTERIFFRECHGCCLMGISVRVATAAPLSSPAVPYYSPSYLCFVLIPLLASLADPSSAVAFLAAGVAMSVYTTYIYLPPQLENAAEYLGF